MRISIGMTKARPLNRNLRQGRRKRHVFLAPDVLRNVFHDDADSDGRKNPSFGLALERRTYGDLLDSDAIKAAESNHGRNSRPEAEEVDKA
jgi:hypothetical protein